MDMTDDPTLDGLELARLVASGETGPLALLEQVRSRILQSDQTIGAVVHRFFDLAERQVAAGPGAGPFAGVPILLKDAGLSMVGTPLTSGSRLYRNSLCVADDTLARRLKAAGFVACGRSKTPEFSLSFATEPEAFGPTCNPWAPGRSAGGSSGGAAAAVAAGMVPVAHASDGAGSIRVPAAHCGVFGFKPSRMRNPLGPTKAESNAGMGTPHAITRSVRDSAAMLDATAGPDCGDPYSVEPASGTFLDALRSDPARLRIGMITCRPDGGMLDNDIAAALIDAARLCSALGHHVEEADLPYENERLKMAWRRIAGVGIAETIVPKLAAGGPLRAEEMIEAVNLLWVDEGRKTSAVDYLSSVNEIHAIARVMGAFFSRFDILLSPVTAEIAPPLGTLSGPGWSLDTFFDRFWSHAPFTAVFNAIGAPAMSVPLYWTAMRDDAPRGIPIGIQFGAGRGQDGLLFSLAGQLERAQPWATRRPDMTTFQDRRS